MGWRSFVAALAFAAAGSAWAADVSDPWEGFNRRVQSFNDFADRWVLKPVAKGYRAITPRLVRQGVGNFFTNLGYPLVAVNGFLQGKFTQGASDTGRFIMNTTLGIGGLFDPASGAGLKLHDEDFGQTFGRWGIGPGPYLVIPLLGPSNVRDGAGTAVSYVTQPMGYVIDDERTRLALNAFNVVQTRAGLLDAEQLIRGDRYVFLRDAFMQRREYLIRDGNVVDTFLQDDGDE